MDPLFSQLAPARPVRQPNRVHDCPAQVDVAVVGAGVVGLSIGWRLRARGLSVAVLDAHQAGSATSAAASGMLAAAAELEPGGLNHLALARASQAAWPGFRAALEADGAIPIGYRDEGTLVMALGREEVERLRARHDLQRRCGLDTRWLTGSAARELEPALRPGVAAGIFCPGDHQVDPALTMQALRAAFLGRGGHLLEGAAVDGLAYAAGRVAGVVAAGTEVGAGVTILASGAAVALASWLPRSLDVPVRPLKGQSLALRARSGPPPIAHVVWSGEVHLAPKTEGRLIVGATMEEAGFDAAITAGGVYALLEGARRVLPAIEEMAIESVWCGFRPTSEDDAPILGETGTPGLAIAAGHHRNGYLLAPATAQAFEDWLVDGRRGDAMDGFGLARFAADPGRRSAA